MDMQDAAQRGGVRRPSPPPPPSPSHVPSPRTSAPTSPSPIPATATATAPIPNCAPSCLHPHPRPYCCLHRPAQGRAAHASSRRASSRQCAPRRRYSPILFAMLMSLHFLKVSSPLCTAVSIVAPVSQFV